MHAFAALRRAVAATACHLAVAAGALLPPVAHAAHPLLTEDTATQGRGRFELELGNQWLRDDGGRSYEFGPQLSWGAVDSVDLIVRPTWVALGGDGGAAHGVGDTAVDFKWRFWQDGARSLAVRAGVDLASGDADRGLGAGHTGYHALVAATLDLPPFAVHGNLGTIHVGAIPLARRDLAFASAALVFTARQNLRFSAEVGAASHPDADRATWPAVARFGVIVAATKWLDCDVGAQTRLNHAAPSRAFLAGATAHW